MPFLTDIFTYASHVSGVDLRFRDKGARRNRGSGRCNLCSGVWGKTPIGSLGDEVHQKYFVKYNHGSKTQSNWFSSKI